MYDKNWPRIGNLGGTLTPRGGNSSAKAGMSVIVSEDPREGHVF